MCHVIQKFLLTEKKKNVIIKSNHRIVQLEEDAQKYEKLKVSVYEDLKDELISKEEYISMKQEFENRRRAALDSIAQIKIEIETLASRNGKHHEWIESFIANKGIEKLERNVVVELIDYIRIYEDKRIEIVFRYADNYKEILNQIRYIQDNKNEMQEVS